MRGQYIMVETIGPHDGSLLVVMSGGMMVRSIGEDLNWTDRWLSLVGGQNFVPFATMACRHFPFLFMLLILSTCTSLVVTFICHLYEKFCSLVATWGIVHRDVMDGCIWSRGSGARRRYTHSVQYTEFDSCSFWPNNGGQEGVCSWLDYYHQADSRWNGGVRARFEIMFALGRNI